MRPQRQMWFGAALLVLLTALTAGCEAEKPALNRDEPKTVEKSDGLQKAPPSQDIAAEPTGWPADRGPVVAYCLAIEDLATASQIEGASGYTMWKHQDVPCIGQFSDRRSADLAALQVVRLVPGLALQKVRLGEVRRDDPAPPMPRFEGPAIRLFGGGLMGKGLVEVGKERDVLLGHFVEFVEEEPFPSPLWLLDGETETAHFELAWDAVWLPDERAAVVGKNRVLVQRGDKQGPELDHREALRKELGVSDTQIDVAAFTDGFVGSTNIVQPVVVRLPTEKGGEVVLEPLPMAGGGALGRRGDELMALLRPMFWEQADPGRRGDWHRLELEGPRWKEPTEEGGPDPRNSVVVLDPLSPPEVGGVLATTPSGRMGLVVVGQDWLVQAARLPAP